MNKKDLSQTIMDVISGFEDGKVEWSSLLPLIQSFKYLYESINENEEDNKKSPERGTESPAIQKLRKDYEDEMDRVNSLVFDPALERPEDADISKYTTTGTFDTEYDENTLTQLLDIFNKYMESETAKLTDPVDEEKEPQKLTDEQRQCIDEVFVIVGYHFNRIDEIFDDSDHCEYMKQRIMNVALNVFKNMGIDDPDNGQTIGYYSYERGAKLEEIINNSQYSQYFELIG